MGTMNQYDKQSRESQLANQIVERLDAIKRRSQGAYDELSVMITLARYPVAHHKIRKMSLAQLQSLWLLVAGYESKTNADLSPMLSASMRPVLAVTTVHQPFTLKRADGTVQHCFLGNDGAEKAFTFLPANKTGTASSSVALSIFTTALAGGELPMASQRSDTEILVRNHDLITVAGDRKIRRVTLSDAGAIQVSYLQTPSGSDVSLTGAAGFTDRPYIEDFCDGVNLWAMEYNDTTNSLRIHKVKLSTGVETIAIVNKIKLGFTAPGYFEGAFYAFGDQAVLFGQQLTGNKSQVLFFTLADGAATPTMDFNVGAPPQVAGGANPYYTRPLVDTAELRGFHLSTLLPEQHKVRLFLTPNLDGTSVDPINVVDVDIIVESSSTPVVGDTANNVTVEKILGQTDGSAVWPLPRTSTAVSNTNMQMAAVTEDGERLIAINGAASPWDVLLFGVLGKRQISAMVPVSSRITTIARLSRMNAAGANMLAVATTGGDTALLEING